MRRTIAILAVAVLLVTAGCTALAPGDDPDATPTEPTDTPATEPGETDDESAAEEQPWIEDGELDADALEGAHIEAVMDAGSFTVASEIATSHDGEDHPIPWFENQTLDTAWNLEHERQLFDNEFRDTPEQLTLYTEGDTMYVREIAGDDTQYSVDSIDRSTDEFTAEMRSDARTGTGAISEWSFTFEETQQCGELTCYQFTGTDFEGDRDVPGTVTDGEATLVVDERGIIRELTQEFDGETDGQDVHVVETSEYLEVGETTLPEPAWVEDAREEDGDSD
ncbi:hypothetical protein RH858_03190 [Halalkaliarchaeum sp. AArc-GB]|uniref:DUF7537 family lipoprotein n=1 Tax=Halalkaliarchaeum sp. AArc-GB TaxID=3074078 RepID=UPI0028670BC2|nr:hypothetical protein [Halalkaliarchaeum sp. AArc-GB]MDR5672160.1 hypothetical protein [Halalkaliarchaeum sp. AArc-GB]